MSDQGETIDYTQHKTLFEKIEDCQTIGDVRRVLHDIVELLDDALASRGGFPPPSK